jgi:molecular chaperone HtpG
MSPNDSVQMNQPVAFKAETRQLLQILIHSLYTEREVFLRELISNASDALTRVNYQMLTNHDVLDPAAELGIWITADPDKHTLTIRDSGIGMTADELVENLGTIAHSGAKAFIEAAQSADGDTKISDIIGQFGVGFYSAFMVADSIRVISHSSNKDMPAVAWVSTGNDTYSLEPAEKEDRGTEIFIQLKEDATEFAQEHRLHEIIKKHSDYIPFPIYMGEKKEQANQQSALWRRQPRQMEAKEYEEFYKQMTLDIEPPIVYTHMAVDAPVQMYAVLFIPGNSDRNIFSLRKQEGLKLYAHNVLIQEYCKDLLPEYLRYVQGVVDSEDLPLNISRESVQSNRVMAQLKKLVTNKLIDTLKTLGKDDAAKYEDFWKAYGRAIKEGVASDTENYEALIPLIRFHTVNQPLKWVSFDDYVLAMKPNQKKIYYIMGDDERSVLHSPHLEAYRKGEYDVLLMTDPLDAFMLLRVHKYTDFDLVNVASEIPETEKKEEGTQTEIPPESLPDEEVRSVIDRIKAQLGERVSEVKTTDRLVSSPARLVDPEGTLNPELQRVYRMLDRKLEVPQKVLEINPRHPIIQRLASLPADSPINELVIEQVYEDALLIEGLHPDPASMIDRIQKIMEKALG